MNKGNKKYEAATFFGPDPATARFVRIFTNNLDEATKLATGGEYFGYVVDVATGEHLVDFHAK